MKYTLANNLEKLLTCLTELETFHRVIPSSRYIQFSLTFNVFTKIVLPKKAMVSRAIRSLLPFLPSLSFPFLFPLEKLTTLTQHLGSNHRAINILPFSRTERKKDSTDLNEQIAKLLSIVDTNRYLNTPS